MRPSSVPKVGQRSSLEPIRGSPNSRRDVRAWRLMHSTASALTRKKTLKPAHYTADKGEPQNEPTHCFGVDDMFPVVATEPISARLTPTVTRAATIRTFTWVIIIVTVRPECLTKALAQLISAVVQ